MQALADASSQPSQDLHIPYRSSVLTYLLKDSLGGNSRTTLLATINPCAAYFDETLSTLRFAERAKKVILRPMVNECAEVVQSNLNVEVERLRSQMTATMERELERRLQESEQQRKELELEWAKKLDDLQKQSAAKGLHVSIDNTLPALVNVSAISCGDLLFYCRVGSTRVGSSDTCERSSSIPFSNPRRTCMQQITRRELLLSSYPTRWSVFREW